MSALVETMAYAGEVPWHGLGTKVPHDLSTDEMLKQSGLDWYVEKELDDLSDNINQGVNERYIDTVPAIGPDQLMTE